MSQSAQISATKWGQLAIVAALTLGANVLYDKWFIKSKKKTQEQDWHTSYTISVNHPPQHGTNIQLPDLKSRRLRSLKNIIMPQAGLVSIKEMPAITEELVMEQIDYQWGQLHLQSIQQDLLKEIDMMTKIDCPFEKINNLIVDLQKNRVQTYPCPLIATCSRKNKKQGFLLPEALVKAGTFVIENCMFKAGQSLQVEKKFLRAGPRSTQYFDSTKVVADIVVLGKVVPGINNIIRELVYHLKDVYGAQRVTGVRFGFKGYLDTDLELKDRLIDLTPAKVQTIHHKGGSFLGLSKKPFDAVRIVNSLVERGVNQLYLIGGNDTVIYAIEIYRQIRKRRLQIALCVNLKAINKDIAYIDNPFGFQSAVEEAQGFVEESYSLSRSNFHSVALIKVPGRYSGFLAMDIATSARNVHACLVPQFPYDLKGPGGLLRYISDKVSLKGYCIIVYSQGAPFAARDIDPETRKGLQSGDQFAFDLFLKAQISQQLKQRGMPTHNVFFTDCQNAVRSVPANASDTKLCCQTALASIQGLMSGYTNFGIGHLKNRIAMIPLDEMYKAEKFHLKPSDENWQRLLATTGQPSFINNEELVSLRGI